jgi:hypothetical protein
MIWTPLTTTIKYGQLLQFDSESGDSRLVIFVSTDQLKILDGTKEIL